MVASSCNTSAGPEKVCPADERTALKHSGLMPPFFGVNRSVLGPGYKGRTNFFSRLGGFAKPPRGRDAIGILYLVSRLFCPLCFRFCDSNGEQANGSDFHRFLRIGVSEPLRVEGVEGSNSLSKQICTQSGGV